MTRVFQSTRRFPLISLATFPYLREARESVANFRCDEISADLGLCKLTIGETANRVMSVLAISDVVAVEIVVADEIVVVVVAEYSICVLGFARRRAIDM